jgi:GNAT superfamily N-acetyltransferase
MLDLRRATDDDAAAVADVFLAAFHATYPAFPTIHTDDETRAWIAGDVVPTTECWVAVDDHGVIGMMALTPGWIEHLYIAPERAGEGIGRRLVELAKARSAGHLELWTFQVNDRARRFYERNGFAAVELTDGSGNEERQPDVRYAWSRASG